MSDACTILTTCGSEETALTIAAALVDQAFAACVNILPGIKSYYYYKGETHLDEEVMLIIKTTQELFPKVSEVITAFPGIEEASVYGVAIPAQDGRAGMAALVVSDSLDFAAFRDHLAKSLPAYAQPLFVRICSEIEVTFTEFSPKTACAFLIADSSFLGVLVPMRSRKAPCSTVTFFNSESKICIATSG